MSKKFRPRPANMAGRQISMSRYLSFKDGAKRKAVYFNMSSWEGYWSKKAKLGFILIGLDIWVGKVPMIRLMLLTNLIMWVLFYLFIK